MTMSSTMSCLWYTNSARLEHRTTEEKIGPVMWIFESRVLYENYSVMWRTLRREKFPHQCGIEVRRREYLCTCACVRVCMCASAFIFMSVRSLWCAVNTIRP